MTEDPKRWSQPFCRTSGCLQLHSWASDFRQSVVKTVCPEAFNEIDVPPTLVSFAVDVASDQEYYYSRIEKSR